MYWHGILLDMMMPVLAQLEVKSLHLQESFNFLPKHCGLIIEFLPNGRALPAMAVVPHFLHFLIFLTLCHVCLFVFKYLFISLDLFITHL